MGAYLSEPVTTKESSDGASKEFNDGCKLSYGASSMQGWRTGMEDSHIHEVNFRGKPDEALFAVLRSVDQLRASLPVRATRKLCGKS